jgi:hypothetical protein
MYSILDECHNCGQALLDVIDLEGERVRVSISPQISARDFFILAFPELSLYQRHFSLVRTVGRYSLSIALDFVPMFLYAFPDAEFSVELRSVSPVLCRVPCFKSLLQGYMARQRLQYAKISAELAALSLSLKVDSIDGAQLQKLIETHELLQHATFTVFLAGHSVPQITIVLSGAVVRVIVGKQGFTIVKRESVRFGIQAREGRV